MPRRLRLNAERRAHGPRVTKSAWGPAPTDTSSSTVTGTGTDKPRPARRVHQSAGGRSSAVRAGAVTEGTPRPRTDPGPRRPARLHVTVGRRDGRLSEARGKPRLQAGGSTWTSWRSVSLIKHSGVLPSICTRIF